MSRRRFIRQFTGILDVDGKKIYEGDTVVQMSGGEPHGDPSKVFFRDGSFMTYVVDKTLYLEMSQNCFGFKKVGA